MDEHELSLLFSALTPEQIAEARASSNDSFRRDMLSHSQNLIPLPPDPKNKREIPPIARDLDTSDPARFQDAFSQVVAKSKPRFPPPTLLPCANVQVQEYMACENPGTMSCSACKLVSYCSKECQKAHWRMHKRDCQLKLRSPDWKPIWITEGRRPSFLNPDVNTDEFTRNVEDGFSAGLPLWGNTPAVDLINLVCNEKDPKKDFSLAIVASGDLRHVLSTLNGLGSNYSGNLNILLNDISLPVVCRNIILLLILGNFPDESMAADMALHFWYSVFMPMEYRFQISLLLALSLEKLKKNMGPIPLGPCSTLSIGLLGELNKNFEHYIDSESLSMGEIQDEYDRVRNAPSRQDLRDRMYAGLKPSHRVAFLQFRRYGILLPFGAINAHFNAPNLSLFSPKGKWLQSDYADPLDGWDLASVIETGKAQGAHPEDIYGCLYFFLSKELRKFARQLRTLKSSFTMLSMDARNLPELIKANAFRKFKIPSSIRFDRIAVSNILDANYAGLRSVLTMWAPFLAQGKHAAIVGYFMNWVILQEDGRATKAGQSVLERLIPAVVAKNKMDQYLNDIQGMLSSVNDIDALYENSKPFSAFLKRQGLDDILRKTNLGMREKNTIFPHRNLTPLGARSNALPEFPDDDTWYYYTKLARATWTERFVEFERKKKS